MISAQQVTILNEDGEPNKEPISFSFANGISYLPFASKDIFDLLSFSFVDIKEGTISIGDSSISPKENKGSLFLLSVNCRDVVSLNAVFSFLDVKGTYEKRKEIGEAIASLKSEAYYTEEEKMRKLDSLLRTLGEHNVAYILLDESEIVNKKHWGIIIDALERYSAFIPSFILGKKAIPLPPKEPEIVVDQNKKEEKPANEIVVEHASSEVPVIPEIKKKKPVEVAPDLDKTKDLKDLFKALFKGNWVSVILIFAFSLLTALGFMLMGALLTSGIHNTSGIVLAIISVIFFLDFVYSMTFIDLPLDKKKRLTIESFLALLSLIGGAVGMLICYAVAKGSFIVKMSDITLQTLITPIIFVVVMVIIPFLSKYIVLLAEKISSLFKKNN